MTEGVISELLPPGANLWDVIGQEITTLTASPISPLLGAGGFGAYKWWRADEATRANLPWFSQPWFFIPALCLVLFCACKESLGTILPPGFKKPLDAIEAVANKVAAIVAAVIFIPGTVNVLVKTIGQDAFGFDGNMTPVAGAEMSTAGFATITVAAVDVTWILYPVISVLAVAAFFLVWMASHTINVLILLSPWGGIDLALKIFRTTCFASLLGIMVIDPRIAAVVSLVVIIIAYFIAGWSFRLTVFGSAFCWDFLTLRHLRFELEENNNKLFCGRHGGAKTRTYGRLCNDTEKGRIVFTYRPWLILPRRKKVVEFSEPPYVAKGIFFSTVREGKITRFILPPRYIGQEEKFAQLYGLSGGVKNAGLRWVLGSFLELFNGAIPQEEAS
jgi:hypothetical protein